MQSPLSAIERKAAEAGTVKDIACFAYDTFYDARTGELKLPSSTEFVNAVVSYFAPDGSATELRLEAEDLYEDLQGLQRGEGAQLAVDLAC